MANVQARASFGHPSRAAARYRLSRSSSQSGCIGYVNWQRNRRRFLHDGVIDAIVRRHEGERARPHRRHRRPGQSRARPGDRAGPAVAGDAGRPARRVGGAGQPRRLCAGRARPRLPCLGALDGRRRRRGRSTATSLPLSARTRPAGTDRRHLRTRHRAVHGQRLLPLRPGAPAGRDARHRWQARAVPRCADPPPAGAQCGGAAQAAVRHRQSSRR